MNQDWVKPLVQVFTVLISLHAETDLCAESCGQVIWPIDLSMHQGRLSKQDGRVHPRVFSGACSLDTHMQNALSPYQIGKKYAEQATSQRCSDTNSCLLLSTQEVLHEKL